jgi:hypothetical protein
MDLKIDNVQSLSEKDAQDTAKVTEKLSEVKAILEAIAQSKRENKVVVKSWFETEETKPATTTEK